MKRKTNMYGVMWEFDRQRQLSSEEYIYWSDHVLPLGWSILAVPEGQCPKEKR